jgi:hypothetical protein
MSQYRERMVTRMCLRSKQSQCVLEPYTEATDDGGMLELFGVLLLSQVLIAKTPTKFTDPIWPLPGGSASS